MRFSRLKIYFSRYVLRDKLYICSAIATTENKLIKIIKKMGKICSVLFSITIPLLLFSTISFSQTLKFGTLSSFETYTGSGALVNAGEVTGNAGTHNGIISGEGFGVDYSGTLYESDSVTFHSRIDLLRVYIHLSDIFVTHPSTHIAAFGFGEVITPGVYSIGAGGTLAGTITLDGGGDPDAVFIMKFEGAFTAGVGSNIILSNGTRAANVFWMAEGAISVGASSTIKGTLLSHPGAITLGVNCNIEGRMFASEGAVTIGAGSVAGIPVGPVTIPISCLGVCTPAPAVDVLGSIENFTLFTSFGAVTNAAASGVIGDVGTGGGGTISGFSTSPIVGTHYVTGAETTQAVIDLDNAYSQLMALTNTELGHSPLFGSGETLNTGVYYVPAAGFLAGTITLDGQNNPDAIFVFKFNGAFSVGAQSKVILTNGASRCNVFWISEGASTIGAFSFIKGTVLAHGGACTMAANGNLDGRMLSTAGAIGSSSSVLYNNTLCFLDDTSDNDNDGLTDAEELMGVFGLIGDPYDYNSPFTHQETTASGTNDDQIFQLEQVEVLNYLQQGNMVHLVIRSGHSLTLTDNISLRDLTIEPGASLDLNGNTVQIKGDLTVNGALIHSQGHIHMNDDDAQRHIYGSAVVEVHKLTIENPFGVVLETALNISGPVHPELGIFDLNNQQVVLTSFPIDGVIKTGSISEIKNGADVVGEITIQRFIESLEDGTRFIGPPIKNLQISDISDDFVTTGFIGSDYPNHYFTNVSYYDEVNRDTNASSGFRYIENATDSLLEHQGYYAYFPPSTTTSILDVTGEFYKGEVTYDLSHTNTGYTANDGWHCVVNPYPSAIDMSSTCVEFNNVSQAIYIIDHSLGGSWQGEYVVYNNGISVNGGTEVVASFQAFMVQATGPDASLTFNECAKTDEQGIFYRSSNEEKSYMRFALQRENEQAYETVIAFDDNATEGFDPSYDARRWEADLYSLATSMNGELLSINTVPEMNDELSIPIFISVPEAGEYELVVSEIVNFEMSSCLFLEDTSTGEITPVNEDTKITFLVEEDEYAEGRFILHSHSIAEVTTNAPFCSEVNSGSALVTLDSDEEASFKWSNFSNELLFQDIGSSSELSGVPSGSYYVQIINPGAICPSSSLEIEIADGEGEIVEINFTPDYCLGGFANVKVKVLGADSWTVKVLKDYELIATGTSSTLVELTELEGYVYDVQVITDCSTNEYVLDLSDDDAVRAKFEAPSELLIENIGGVELEVEVMSENAEYHQWFLDDDYRGEDDVISFTFDEVGSYTLKLNSSNEHCDDTYEQQIMVSAASVIQENLEKDFFTVNRESEISIIRLNDRSGRIDVTLYDVKGSKIAEYLATTKNRISIDKQSLSGGVYILEIRTEDGQVMSRKYSK